MTTSSLILTVTILEHCASTLPRISPPCGTRRFGTRLIIPPPLAGDISESSKLHQVTSTMRWLWDGLCLFTNVTHYHRCRNSRNSQPIRIFYSTLVIVLLVYPYDVSALMSNSRKLELRYVSKLAAYHFQPSHASSTFPSPSTLCDHLLGHREQCP